MTSDIPTSWYMKYNRLHDSAIQFRRYAIHNIVYTVSWVLDLPPLQFSLQCDYSARVSRIWPV